MTTFLSPQPILQFFDNNGDPLVGARLYTYEANSTTPLVTYTDSSGGTENPNPVIADSRGEMNVWLGPGPYKFVLKTATDVPIWTVDNIVNVQQAIDDFIALLASESGSSYIGFIQAGTGAVARTSESKMRERVSVLDFGAIAGGSAVTNYNAFTNAINYIGSTGQTLYIPSGTYRISHVLTTTSDLIMEGDGDTSIIDVTGIAGGFDAITVTGSLTQIEDIAVANQGNATITFVSPPSLSVPDVFVLYDPTDYSWSTARSYYRAGEWCEFRGSSGNDAYLTNTLYAGYNPASLNVYKLNSPVVSLKNFRVVGTSVENVIKISLCNKPVVENVTGYSEGNSILIFDRCYNVRMVNRDMYNKGRGTDDYGISIGNCQNVRIWDGEFYARRHGIAAGGGDDTACVPTRNVRVIGATIKNDVTSNVYSADMHGNIEDFHYQDCRIYNGAAMSGKDSGYDNCVITASGIGVIIYVDEVKGGELRARNCDMLGTSDPSSGSRGIIDVGGTGAVVTTYTDNIVNLVIENCFIRGSGFSGSTEFVKFVTDDCPVATNITIRGITADVNAMNTILRTDKRSGTAHCDAIIVDDVCNFPAGTVLHTAAGDYYRDKPSRMMRQSGQTTMTAASGTSYTLPVDPISFRYPYPRIPTCQATVGGATGLLANGNYTVWANLYQIAATSIHPYIESGSTTNWNASTSVTVNWTSGIEEI